MTSNIGYTEFVPINVKAKFKEVDLVTKEIITEIHYNDQKIATLVYRLNEGVIHKSGDISSVEFLRTSEVNEEFILGRLYPMWNSIIINNNSNPEESFL